MSVVVIMTWWCSSPPKTNDMRPCADKYEELVEENKKLEKQNKELRKRLKEADAEWSRNIDAFVDQWFEENHEDVDIGVIDLKICKIDVFPDYLEKHIYKKVLKIVYSFITSSLSPKVSDEEQL